MFSKTKPMNRSSFCRLIKHMDALCLNPSIVVWRQHYVASHHNFRVRHSEEHDPNPFSFINPRTKADLVDHYWRDISYTPKKLGPGMVLLKNYITFKGQVDILNICEKWGVGPGGFYQPNDQSGVKLQRHMMCFGRNWDPVTGYKERFRSDGSEPPPLPYEFISLAENVVHQARVHGISNPKLCADICVANFYSLDGQLGLHQDCDESSYSLGKRLPVVSVSIGDSAEFLYGHTTDESKLDQLLLESGDALIFGGDSRLIFHGVKRILPHSAPLPLLQETMLRPGRLNLTLKRY